MSDPNISNRKEQLRARTGGTGITRADMSEAGRGDPSTHNPYDELNIVVLEPSSTKDEDGVSPAPHTNFSTEPPSIEVGQTISDDRMPQYYTWRLANAWFRIDINKKALEEVQGHASSLENRKIEVFGLLWGTFGYRDGQVLTIEHAITTSVRGNETNFTIGGSDWMEIEAKETEVRRQHPDWSRVGWYHTHPHMDIFYSANDEQVHRHLCPHPWMVGLVYDPFKNVASFIVKNQAGNLETHPPQGAIFNVTDAFQPERLGPPPIVTSRKGKKARRALFSARVRRGIALTVLACVVMGVSYGQRARLASIFNHGHAPKPTDASSSRQQDGIPIAFWKATEGNSNEKNEKKVEVRWNPGKSDGSHSKDSNNASDILRITRSHSNETPVELAKIPWQSGTWTGPLPPDSRDEDLYRFARIHHGKPISLGEMPLKSLPERIDAQLDGTGNVVFKQPQELPRWGVLKIYRTEYPDTVLFQQKLSSTGNIGEKAQLTTPAELPPMHAQHSRYCVVWQDDWKHWAQILIEPKPASANATPDAQNGASQNGRGAHGTANNH